MKKEELLLVVKSRKEAEKKVLDAQMQISSSDVQKETLLAASKVICVSEVHMNH